jgi:hypothetical protein
MNEFTRRLNARPATAEETADAIYGVRQERFPDVPSRQDDPDHSHRELANGNLGGRRGLKMRRGDDRRSRNERRRKPTEITILRPRAGMTFPLFQEENMEATGTDGTNVRKKIPHNNRGGFRPRPGIR